MKVVSLVVIGCLLPFSSAGAGSTPIRLTDLLDRAEIESPLQKAKKGRESTEAVFGEDFQRFRPARARWKSGGPCRVVPDENDPDNRVLEYRGGGGHKCHFVLPARPSTLYRIRRLVLSDDPDVDLRVLEHRRRLKHPKTLNHPRDLKAIGKGKFIKASNLLFVHHFPRPAGNDAWQEDTIELFTTPFAHSLVILIQDAESAVGATDRDARFDDLAVERVTMDPVQELVQWKKWNPAENARPGRGMIKHGQFLPIGDAGKVKPPFDANHDYRLGLFAPAPTRIAFPEIEVPPSARLSFSLGLMRTSRPGDRVTFQVRVEADREASPVFEKTIEAQPFLKNPDSQWHWFDQEISLEKWAGKKVRLIFETRLAGKSRRGHAIFGHPMIWTPRQKDDPPNLILVAVDTLRADRLSCYGHESDPRRTSPAIDALAADGVLFKRVLAASNWTTPSFATVFTGLPASHHGVVHRASAIGPGRTTLAEHFQHNGWTTHGIAYKTYLYNMGFEQGFDRWFNLPRIHVRARDNLAKATAWLKKHHDRRFFLFLHFNDPHQPFNQPAPFDRLYNRADALNRYGLSLPIIIGPSKGAIGCDKCRENGKTKKDFKRLASRLYDGEVAYLDSRLGMFFDQLKAYGIYDDSWIVLFSDHGEIIYEYGEFYGHGSHRLDDEVLWVPLIIKPPASAGFKKNQVVSSQVRLADLYPTLLELAGIQADSPEGALSLVKLLQDPGAGRDRLAASENVKHHVLSLRHRDWMYALDYKPERSIREKLFHRRRYPTRGQEVKKKHPDVLRRFRLRAVDFFLTHRPGKYLLVMGDDQTRDVRLHLEASRPMKGFRSFFGISRTRRLERSGFEVSGRTDSPILLFARLPERARGKIRLKLRDRRHPEDDLETTLSLAKLDDYLPGSLKSIRKKKGISVHLFGNRHGKKKVSRRRVNPDTVEALRSLGYVD